MLPTHWFSVVQLRIRNGSCAPLKRLSRQGQQETASGGLPTFAARLSDDKVAPIAPGFTRRWSPGRHGWSARIIIWLTSGFGGFSPPLADASELAISGASAGCIAVVAASTPKRQYAPVRPRPAGFNDLQRVRHP